MLAAAPPPPIKFQIPRNHKDHTDISSTAFPRTRSKGESHANPPSISSKGGNHTATRNQK